MEFGRSGRSEEMVLNRDLTSGRSSKILSFDKALSIIRNHYLTRNVYNSPITGYSELSSNHPYTQTTIMSMFGLGRPQPSSAEKIAAAEQEMDLVTDMFNKYAIASLKWLSSSAFLIMDFQMLNPSLDSSKPA